MKNEKDRALAMAILLITVTVFSTICCMEGLLSDDFSAISWAASSLMIGVWICGIAYYAFNSVRRRRIWQLVIVTAGAVILTVFALIAAMISLSNLGICGAAGRGKQIDK